MDSDTLVRTALTVFIFGGFFLILVLVWTK